ncbi:MAG: response regulator [Candidatus Aminicenantes bacterium]|jgi:DNA-binding response OmpR family regulator
MSINSRKERSKKEKPLILMVDDVPRNLQLLAAILKQENKYEVAAATSGSAALKIVDNVLPDLILLDIMMPEMDGFEVCQKLKASPSTRDIPVVFLTAKAGLKDIVKGFQMGGLDYITKPFNGTELLARVQTHIELKQSKEKLNDSLQKLQLANQHLTDSINYAQLIQEAVMPQKQDIKAVFKESFVFLKPRDIVSGDFFWILDSPERIILAAVDCTGHGVPGAFVSMLSYQLMHEIIVMRGFWEPDLILNELNKRIKSVFNQGSTEVCEGMDVAICSLDMQNRVLEFAGAKNPLVYIYNNDLHHIKGDRVSIGGFRCSPQKENRFTKQVIPIRDSTMYYIYSDGFPDQLGGDQGHRFTQRRFRELLRDIYQLPLQTQEKALARALEDWMGDEYDQIDDILVIGFKPPG